jgi:hypothetical protein
MTSRLLQPHELKYIFSVRPPKKDQYFVPVSNLVIQKGVMYTYHDTKKQALAQPDRKSVGYSEAQVHIHTWKYE